MAVICLKGERQETEDTEISYTNPSNDNRTREGRSLKNPIKGGQRCTYEHHTSSSHDPQGYNIQSSVAHQKRK